MKRDLPSPVGNFFRHGVLILTAMMMPKALASGGSIGSVELSMLLFSPTHSTQFRDSYGFYGGFYRSSPKGRVRLRMGLVGGFSSGILNHSSTDYGYVLLQMSAHLGFEAPVLSGPYGSPFLFAEGLGGRTLLTLDTELSGEDRIDLWTYGYRAGMGFRFGGKRRSLRVMAFFRGEPATIGGRKIDIGGIGGTLAFTF